MSHEERIRILRDAWKEIEPGQDVEISLFRPEDAQGVSLAYFEVYGEAFPIEHVYDPQVVIERNSTEDQYTIVARTPRNEVVGLAGLFRHAPNPDIYEAGQLMVLKSYRKTRYAAELAKVTLGEQPRALGIPVVFGEAVCNHPVSQRLAIQEKLVPTGLEIECMPAHTYAGEGGVTRNVSLLLLFRVDTQTSGTVHVPQEYRDIAGQLFASMELERAFGEGQPLSGDTDSEEFLLPDAGLARLTARKAGTDFIEVISALDSQVGLVQVYLNLGDPAAIEAVSLLRQRGYFFGGLLPQWFGDDGLVMQKLPAPPDWEALRLYGKAAEAMRDFVRQDYESVTGS